METGRELFLKYDYVEAKDLCKQFITVVSGVLVFSLTFADKVINFGTASFASRVMLLSSWCCFLLAIIAGGTSLAYISVNAGRVVYQERQDYERISVRTMVGVAMAGGLFVLGLLLLTATVARAVLA